MSLGASRLGVWRDVQGHTSVVGSPIPRRFPPPWSVDDPDVKLGHDCYIVRDANGLIKLPVRTLLPLPYRR